MYSNYCSPRPVPLGRNQEASGELKLHADTLTALNTVTAYGPGFIEINKVRHTSHLLVTPDRLEPWNSGFESLSAADFEQLAQLQPEVVLLGTGAHQRFPHPALTRPLADRHIGCEVMDTRAACRTYNILAAEGRKVLAALLIEP
jgi:uncharacterized protein